MPKSTHSTHQGEAAIWERIIHPQGAMTIDEARRIVELDFSDAEKQRMHELAERNRAGTLATGEEEELDDYCRVGNTLALLKSRARQVLKTQRRVS